MPIHLVTGLPRAGKSLWTICHVKERAEREGRTVYTCNIPGVTIPGWQVLDHPDKWEELPDGAIIICDEVQDFWQKQTAGPVPRPILNLSKHGKRGFDFYFITQEPNLIHSTPRDLCAEHYYIVRAWGSHNALVHKFTRYELHPDKVRKKAEKVPFRYPKEAFNWYKSADVHNIKRRIPLRIIALPVGVVVLILGGWFGLQTFLATVSGKASETPLAGLLSGGKPSPSPSAAGASGGSVAVPPAPSSRSKGPEPLTVGQYIEARTPRIEGLPHTAPVFDEITRPAYAPRPAACVSMGKRCDCYTQQGTILRTPRDVCLQIVDRGYFMEWREEPAPQLQHVQRAVADKPASSAGRVLPMPEFPKSDPRYITQADIPQALALRNPAHTGGVRGGSVVAIEGPR